jgi:hypothetical protein
MGALNKRVSSLSGATIALWVVPALLLVGAGTSTGAVHLGSMAKGDGQQPPKNPAELLIQVPQRSGLRFATSSYWTQLQRLPQGPRSIGAEGAKRDTGTASGRTSA